MTRTTIAQHVSERLFAAERSITKANIDNAALVSALHEGGEEVGMSLEMRHEALVRAMRSLNTSFETLGSLVETHRELARLGSIVVPSFATGGGGSKEPQPEKVRRLTGIDGGGQQAA